MKKTRYSEEQIVNILKEGEAEISVAELRQENLPLFYLSL